jgi:hypothetical protein
LSQSENYYPKGNLVRSLFRASIWAPGAIPKEEWKYRNMKRVVFPSIDVLLLFGGLAAGRFGVPAIREFYPEYVTDFFAYVLAGSAIVCFVGVSFPRMWPLEIAGKSVVFGMLFGYFCALLILVAQGYRDRGFSSVITAIAICFIVWRLSILGSEWQERRLIAEAEAAFIAEEEDA